MSDAIPQFRAAMRATGLEPPDLIEPGKLHRFPGIGKRRPAFANNFRPGANDFAVICIGWPPARPPARHVVVLPPDLRPAEIDWGLVRTCAAFVTPVPGCRADPEQLRELLLNLGVELARAGVRSFVLFNGERVIREYWRDRGDRPGVPA